MSHLRTSATHFKSLWPNYLFIGISLVALLFGGRNLFLLFLIIISVLGLVLKRIKPVEVFFVVLLFSLFYLPLFETFAKLREINKQFFSNVTEVAINVFTPDSGLEMLPKRVQSAGYLLQDHHIQHFQISKILADDWEIRERMVEGQWPRQWDGSSKYWVVTEHELPVFSRCKKLGEKETIYLVECD